MLYIFPLRIVHPDYVHPPEPAVSNQKLNRSGLLSTGMGELITYHVSTVYRLCSSCVLEIKHPRWTLSSQRTFQEQSLDEILLWILGCDSPCSLARSQLKTVLLSQPPKCWNCRCVPQQLHFHICFRMSLYFLLAWNCQLIRLTSVSSRCWD